MVDNAFISDRNPGRLILVKLWDPAAREELECALAVVLPSEPMHFGEVDCGRVYALAPGEFLIEGSLTHAIARERLTDLRHTISVTDITAGRRSVTLRGAGAEYLLAGGCTIDLHIRAFPIGSCALTKFSDVPALIARTSAEQFEFLCDRLYYSHLIELFETAEIFND